MFIRTRTRERLGYGRADLRHLTINGKPWRGKGTVVTYYQALESYRDDAGRPRHRVLASWRNVPTVVEAIAACEQSLVMWRGYVERDRQFLAQGLAEQRQGGCYVGRSEMVAGIARLERMIATEETRLAALAKVKAMQEHA